LEASIEKLIKKIKQQEDTIEYLESKLRDEKVEYDQRVKVKMVKKEDSEDEDENMSDLAKDVYTKR